MIGLISAFEEEGRIGRAVRSLLKAGCARVVVVDGAWTGADGHRFGGGGLISEDATRQEAELAGAEFVIPADGFASDGEKRNIAIHLAGAQEGDHLFLLDADEEVQGKLEAEQALPWNHSCVILRNLAPNDLPGIRGTWPSGDHSDTPIPLLRWLRYTPELRCTAPGAYWQGEEKIEPYLVNAMREHADRDRITNLAYAALREVEQHLPPPHASILPILKGVEILHHGNPAKADAKRRYYEAVA